ncbi:MAG: N-acetylmuramic acid 6-phosphate etherase, partial [Cyanobacteriota bacterium]
MNKSPSPAPGTDRGHLLTEQANPLSEALDSLPTADLVALFCENDLEPQRAVAAAAPVLTAAIEAIAERVRAGGRLCYLGAGPSGRLGVLDAAECPPTFCSPPELVQGVLAGGAAALLRSSEGLEDLRDAGRDDLVARGFQPGDALVGIAAGGTTPYVHGALEHARGLGALAVGCSSAAPQEWLAAVPPGSEDVQSSGRGSAACWAGGAGHCGRACRGRRARALCRRGGSGKGDARP